MSGMTKFGYKIRTRGGMTVENLLVHARTRELADTRIRQIYRDCEILECTELTPEARGDGLDLEGMISLISKQDEPR